jgi:flagellar M-ring protein FliF
VAEALDRLLGSGPPAWTRLGRGAQILVLAAALLAPLLFFGTQWVSEGQYVPLFSSLPPEEGGAILAQLKASKTPYKIGGNGDQILVPADKVSEARLRLAMQGLPVGGGVGFEVFDRPSLGVSDFAQRLNYQRALQGELARTIGQLREVARARVHLVLPQPSLFTDRDRPASASVFVKLAPGAQLGKEQVRGIVHLVASSVEGLSPERVTLVDTAGRVLSTGGDSATGPLSGKRLEVKTALEEGLERRVQTLLDSALGAGQAITRVSAQVNFDQMEKTEEKFDPQAQVVRQKTRSTETTKGRSTTPSTTPPQQQQQGTTVTDPAAVQAAAAMAQATAATSTNDGNRESENVTYEVSRIVAKTLTSPGEIRRLSVAVVVNAKPAPAADPKADPKAAPAPPVARTPEELEKIRQVVMTAVGFSEPRGDSVTVTEMPFDTSALDRERALLDQPAPAPGPKGLTLSMPMIIGAASVVVVVIVLAVWLSLRGRTRARERAAVALSLERVPETTALPREAPVAAGLPAAPAAAAAVPSGAPSTTALARAMAAAQAARAPQPIVPEDMLQLTREREDIREKAFQMASSEPDATAQLLRAWLVKKKTPPQMTSHGA